MSQHQLPQRHQVYFCPHLRLQTTLQLLFPSKVPQLKGPSPEASICDSSETTSSSSSSSLSSSPNKLRLQLVNGIGGGDARATESLNYNLLTINTNQSQSKDTGLESSSDELLSVSVNQIGDETNINIDQVSSPKSINHEGDGESVEVSEPLIPSAQAPRESEDDTDQVQIKIKKFLRSRNKREKSKKSTSPSCLPCEELSSTAGSSSARKKKVNFWKCLEPSCQAVLCGTSGENHAQMHYQDNPHHTLQENTASKRIWCNECSHEIFRGFRNRRLIPAIWVADDEDEPPKGLYNIGNTCFMNAALQNIAAVQPLASYLLGECSDLTGKYVAANYRWLLGEFYLSSPTTKYNKGIMPSRLLHSVRTAHPIFRGFQQHDAQEFLRLFMDSLAEQTLIPHFILDKVKAVKESSDNESETESFETCDSGNGSEETDATHKQGEELTDSETNEVRKGRPVKIVMKSIISDIFDGQIESSVQCLSCHQTSRRNEVFQDLSLPIPTKDEITALRGANSYEREEQSLVNNNSGWLTWFWDWMKSFFWGPAPTLEDCFSAFFSSDELKGKNMYSCEKCGKLRNGIKRCFLYKLPEVLCVHLKRFRMYEFNGGMGYSGKISQYVQFPSDFLDVRPYMHKDCTDEVSNYKLLGIICHIGSVMGGHYTSYIRKGDQWFLADDSHIAAVPWETVMDCEAYVLFYQKWSLEEDENRHDLLKLWTNVDKFLIEEEKFHLVSRKWITRFFWGEEGVPLDNSDVVCPHGHLAPYESVEYGCTWIPDSVWDLIMKRYGGGPDLLYNDECKVCAQAWRKHQRTSQKSGTGSRSHSFSDTTTGSPKSKFTLRNGTLPNSSSPSILNNAYSRLEDKLRKQQQRKVNQSEESESCYSKVESSILDPY